MVEGLVSTIETNILQINVSVPIILQQSEILFIIFQHLEREPVIYGKQIS